MAPAQDPRDEGLRSPVVKIAYQAWAFREMTRDAQARMARHAEMQGVALDDFALPSRGTMEWRVWMGRMHRGTVYRKDDLFWADLPGRGFVGAVCTVGGSEGRAYLPERCTLNMDWRGAEIYASFNRVMLEDWQSIVSSVFDLLDHYAIEPAPR